MLNGLMAFPNLVGLFFLSGVVRKLTREYFNQRKQASGT
jgi:Na+/alanine symporter